MKFVVHIFSNNSVSGVAYTLLFDENYINNPRLILQVDGKTYNQQPFNYTGILRSGSPSCRTFKFSLEVYSDCKISTKAV